MENLDVRLRLSNLHCFTEGDGIGSAEPYLWTVFFKIDGETAFVNPSLQLEGTATVLGRPGDHGNLPNHDVDAGETVLIPAALGEFNTRLRPIPLREPINGVTAVGGVVGVITVLMEEDGTSASAVAAGHEALNAAVRSGLNALIPRLGIRHPEPTSAEIDELTEQVGELVTDAIGDNVSVWDWLRVFGDMDDKVGSAVFRFSHEQLAEAGPDGIPFDQRFQKRVLLRTTPSSPPSPVIVEDWKIEGRVQARVVGAATGSLEVKVDGVPATLQTNPVHISGAGFQRSIKTTTTFTGLPIGPYAVTSSGFTTGRPSGPTCRIFTPNTGSQRRNVVVGETASVSVSFTSEPCD